VPWTKPEDVGYDPREAPPKLGGITPGEFNGAFGNGSVRRFASTLDEKTLRAIITRAGKEPVDVSKLP